MKKISAFSASIAAALAISACGGGGGDSGSASTASAAQGLWIGTTTTNRTVTGLVFSDGTYYVLYSPVGNPTAIAGVVQGSGTTGTNTFSSSNARDFNLEGLGVLSATVSANYAAKQAFNGTVNYTNGGVTSFATTYNSAYETAPTLANVAGTYTGQVALSIGVQSATVIVSSNGTISGGGNGCALSGTATPRTDGNAYTLSITFGASPCFFANQTFTGVAYYNSATKRLYGAAPNAARTDGVLFVGTKP